MLAEPLRQETTQHLYSIGVLVLVGFRYHSTQPTYFSSYTLIQDASTLRT
jgi:hypothetical protein